MHTDAIHHLSYVRAEVEGDGFIGVRCEADTTYALRWCVEFCYSIALGDDVSEFRKQVIGCAYEFTVVDVKRDYMVVSGVSWAVTVPRVQSSKCELLWIKVSRLLNENGSSPKRGAILERAAKCALVL